MNELEKTQIGKKLNVIDYRKDERLQQRQVELCGEGNLVLDVGCHDGTLSKKIAKKNRVEGLEMNKSLALKARKKGLRVFIGKVQSIPAKDNTYDLVHMSEVIEHILDTDKALREIHRVLKPNGRVIITTPNTTSFRDRVLVLFGKLPAYVSHPEHVRFFNVKRLKNYLERNNFRDVKAHGTGFVIPFPGAGAKYFFAFDRLFPAGWMERLIVMGRAEKRGRR